LAYVHFRADQLAMPAQQRVRCDDRGNLPEGASAQPVCPSRESAPVVVGQAHASPTQMTPQHPILFQQTREIQPATKNEEGQLKKDASSTDAV